MTLDLSAVVHEIQQDSTPAVRVFRRALDLVDEAQRLTDERDRLRSELHEARSELERVRAALTCPMCGAIMQSRRGDHPELIISSESRGDEWVWLCGGCVRLVAQEVDVETGRRDWLQQPEVWAFVQGRIAARRAK